MTIGFALLLLATQPVAAEPGKLAPLDFLVGHCWQGEFKARSEVDTHCFESVYGGKHVRDRHEVTGGKGVYRGETIFSWNAETGQAEYTYWNSNGGVSRGAMVANGKTIDFGEEVHTRADGSKLTISTVMRILGPAAYEVVSMRNGVTGDNVVTYRRVD